MRITVATILEYLAAGDTVEKILKAYPILEAVDIKACQEYTRTGRIVSTKRMFKS
jgi:uncharacterized protein (DUF433 family)